MSPSKEQTIIGPVVNMKVNASESDAAVTSVLFQALYDGAWHMISEDTEAPYEFAWNVPGGVISQKIILSIHVKDSLGNEFIDPAGLVEIYYQSITNEASVPEEKRAYLNQRSLGEHGGSMCSEASLTMLLAMNGSIKHDYETMKTTAANIWNEIGVPGPYIVSNYLKKNGYTSILYTSGNYDEEWKILKQEIAAGRPVIIDSPKGAMTPSGHYIVGVGYKESPSGERTLYAYDPFGKHKDCYPASSSSCNTSDLRWNYNSTKSNSEVGKWVAYPWEKLQPKLITAQRLNPESTLFETLADESVGFRPDLITTELPEPGSGDPHGEGANQMHLPLLSTTAVNP